MKHIVELLMSWWKWIGFVKLGIWKIGFFYYLFGWIITSGYVGLGLRIS